MRCFEKNVKNLDFWDIGLIKWSVAGFVLFVLTIWPAVMDLVKSVNPWYFFTAFLILAIRPFYRFFKK
jgi:hypothetical protein